MCYCCTAVQEFEVTTRALSFQNGDTVGVVRCISVSIMDDTKVENDEHFNFNLINGQGTQFNESSIEIYIIEDDGMLTCVCMPIMVVKKLSGLNSSPGYYQFSVLYALKKCKTRSGLGDEIKCPKLAI